VRGFIYTMLLTALSIGGSLLMGVIAAIVVDRKIPLVSKTTHLFMSFGRLTPPLLMMYLLFFGIGGLLLAHYSFKIHAMFVAVFCLGFYSAGIVMSALLDAADYLRKTDSGFRLSLKTMNETIDYSRWPIRQALINVTKMSMISSAIAIPELLSSANLIMAEKGNLIVMMSSILIAYYLITSFWIKSFDILEKYLFGAEILDEQ
jgi:polar amino acid transport system substrate-binding protein